MSKPNQPPADHPLDDKLTIITDSESDDALSNSEDSSDRISKPNLDDIRTAGY